MRKISLSLIISLTLNMQVNAGLVIPPPLLIVGQGGAGADCTHNSIQAAIDVAGPESEIRVTTESTYFENLKISSDLTLNGGYANCELAQLDVRLDEERTVIDASTVLGGNAVVVIGDAIQFNMSGFTLNNGEFGGAAQGGAVSILADDATIVFNQMNITNNSGMFGGGIFLENNIDLTLFDTVVDNNIAPYGGGIYLSNDTDLTLSNTAVHNNTSSAGGGIFCSDSSVGLNDNSGIYQNLAIPFKTNGIGGGIYGSNCSIFLRSGLGGTADFRSVGISSNSATGSGGGIYADGGLIIPSGYAGIINIDNNIANSNMNTTGDGGGIYLTGGAFIDLRYMFFEGNTAYNGNGGALFMDNSQYRANSTTAPFDSCILNGFQECSFFINNQATGDGLTKGGAIYMQNNSSGLNPGDSLRARFINNRADGGAAIAIYSGSTLNLQNSYFIGNGNNGDDDTNDFNVIRVNGAGSEVDISFSTLANNRNSFAISLFNSGKARLYKSIVYEEQSLTHLVTSPTDSAEFSFGCSLFHEGVTPGPFPGFNNSLITTNPGFENPDNDNYHLRLDSPAIDRCTSSGLSPDVEIRMDFDGDGRPIDIPGTNNSLIGTYDAGADEYHVTGLIFASSFD